MNGLSVITASAGTGKTHALEQLVLEHVLRGGRVDEVLVLTFAVRATQELRQRIRERLQAALREAAAPLDRRRLARAVSAVPAAPIHTIHAFAQRALAAHAVQVGLPLRQEHVDEDLAFGEAFGRVLREELAVSPGADDLALWLRRGHFSARGRRGGRVGQLEDLLREVQQQQAAPFPPQAGDALGPDVGEVRGTLGQLRAGSALEARLRDLLCDLDRRTVDALVRRLLRARELAQVAGPGALEGATALLPALRDLREPDLRGALRALGDASPRARPFAAALLRLCDFDLNAQVATRWLPRVRARIEREKRARGAFGYADLLRRLDAALDDPALGAALRARFELVLVDESQDNDEVQWRLLRRLFWADPATARRVVVVGDPKQAIYAFRGADVLAFLRERDGVPAPRRRTLDESWRSSPALVAVHNQLFPHLLTGAVRHEAPVRAARPDLALVDEAGRPLPPLVLVDRPGTGTPGDAIEALADGIAREARRLCGGGGAGSSAGARLRGDGADRPLSLRDLLVLTRFGWEGRLVTARLRAAGVPTVFKKEPNLLGRPETDDVLRLLTAILDPRDGAARRRALATPFFGASLEDLGADAAQAGPALERLHAWHALSGPGRTPELLARLVDETGLARRAALLAEDRRHLVNVEHVLELATARAAGGRWDLAQVVAWLRALRRGDVALEDEEADAQRLASEDGEAVQVLTIHAAKGGEAPVVFVVGGLDPPRKPVQTFRGDDPAPHLFHDADGARRVFLGALRDLQALDPDAARRVEEERRGEDERLLYVACTRARVRLYLPWFAPGGELPAPGSCYERLNAALPRAFPPGAPMAGVQRRSARALPVLAPAAAPPDAAWTPSAALLDAAAPAGPDEALRARARPWVGYSYSRLSRRREEARRAADALDAAADDAAEPAPDAVPPAAPDLELLPPGAGTGRAVHALLEELPLDGAPLPPLEEWLARSAVREVVDRVLRGHGLDPALAGAAFAAHAHRALATPVSQGGLVLPDGLATAERPRRELEFFLRLPDAAAPWVESAVAAVEDVTVARGFLRGYLDLVFLHAGRLWVLDWKTDVVDDVRPEALAARVERAYRTQVEVYTLALARLLGVTDRAGYEARVGGHAYVFTRALAPGQGVAAGRLPWEELDAFARRLEGECAP